MGNEIAKLADETNKDVDPFILFIDLLEQLKTVQQSKEEEFKKSRGVAGSAEIIKDQFIKENILDGMEFFLKIIKNKIKDTESKKIIEQFEKSKDLALFSNFGLSILKDAGSKNFDITFKLQENIVNCENINEYYDALKGIVFIFQNNISTLQLKDDHKEVVLGYIKEYLSFTDQIQKKINEVENQESSKIILLNPDRLDIRDPYKKIYYLDEFNSPEELLEQKKIDGLADQMFYIALPIISIFPIISIYKIQSDILNENFQKKINECNEAFGKASDALTNFQNNVNLKNIYKIEKTFKIEIEDLFFKKINKASIIDKKFFSSVHQFKDLFGFCSNIRRKLGKISEVLLEEITDEDFKKYLTEYIGKYSQIIYKMEEKLNEIHGNDKNQNDNNADKLKEEKKSIEELNKKFKKNNKKLDELNSKILKKEEDIKSKETQNENNENIIERNNKSIERKTNEIDAANVNSAMQKLSREIENKQSERDKLNNKNNLTEEKLNRLNTELQNELTILQNDLVNLQNNLGLLNASKAKLQNSYKKFQSEIKRLNPLLFRNALFVESINDSLIINTNFFNENAGRLKEINDELNKNSALIASKQDNKKNQYRWDDKDKSQKSIENEVEKLRSKNDELYLEKEKLDKENQEMQKIIDGYNKEKALLENHNINIKNRIQYYKEEIKNNQIKQKKIKDEIDSLDKQDPKEKELIERKNKSLEGEILSLDKENQKLQNDILLNAKAILKLKEEIKNNKKKIYVIKEENHSIQKEVWLVKSCNVNDGYKSSSSESESSKNIKQEKEDISDTVTPKNLKSKNQSPSINYQNFSQILKEKKSNSSNPTKEEIELLKMLPGMFKKLVDALNNNDKNCFTSISNEIHSKDKYLKLLKCKIESREYEFVEKISESIKEESLYVFNEIKGTLRYDDRKVISCSDGLERYITMIFILYRNLLSTNTESASTDSVLMFIQNFLDFVGNLVGFGEILAKKKQSMIDDKKNNLSLKSFLDDGSFEEALEIAKKGPNNTLIIDCNQYLNITGIRIPENKEGTNDNQINQIVDTDHQEMFDKKSKITLDTFLKRQNSNDSQSSQEL